MGPARFSLERFEAIATTPRHSLLRLRGRWGADDPLALSAPQLVVSVEGQAQRYAPLDPGEAAIAAAPEPEPWRCAFAVPAALLDDGAADFALAGAGGSISLPAPIGVEPGDPTREGADHADEAGRRAAERAAERDEARERAAAAEEELSASQAALEAERAEAGRRAQEASERAARLAVQLRERESATPS